MNFDQIEHDLAARDFLSTMRDDTGAIVAEPAVVVEVVTLSEHERETITKYADSIGAKYGETAILLTTGAVITETLYCS